MVFFCKVVHRTLAETELLGQRYQRLLCGGDVILVSPDPLGKSDGTIPL
jgi:hypothetical protein